MLFRMIESGRFIQKGDYFSEQNALRIAKELVVPGRYTALKKTRWYQFSMKEECKVGKFKQMKMEVTHTRISETNPNNNST